MSIIFFDLETSDKEFCGQILNYCFISTDSRFNSKDILHGNVALSRLQIPSAGALLANRIRLSEHQGDLEEVALRKIWEFITRTIKENNDEPVVLCGYNSARFDVPFLRTSFIRNGFNPYFSGKLIYRDVYQAVKYLALANTEFRTLLQPDPAVRLSLKLEKVTSALGLLHGLQTHESKDDVLLLCDLCRSLENKYGFDTTRFAPYEVQLQGGKSALAESIVHTIDVRHAEENGEFFSRKTLHRFRDSPKQSLWLNIEAFQSGKRKDALHYFTKGSSYLFIEAVRPASVEEQELLMLARKELQHVTLENYFERSTCDIEADIYRVGFKEIEALGEAIWNKNQNPLRNLENRDSNILLGRWKLRTLEFDERVSEMLGGYARYRYGGGMQLTKTALAENVRYFPTLQQMMTELEALKATVSDDAGLLILMDLEKYIWSSEIFAATAGDLLPKK